MRNQRSKIKNHTSTSGFSLVEVLIATLLVGLSIAALVAANGSFSQANVTGADLSTAEFLIEQIRELTTMLPLVDLTVGTWNALGPESGETTVGAYNEVDDFNGFDSATLGAPISTQGVTLPDLAAFRQQVTVQKVNPSDFNQTLSPSDSLWNTSDFARVTVTILRNGQPISSASWVRARY